MKKESKLKRDNSIIQKDLSVCYFCKTPYNLHTHEVFYGTANRKKSIEDGCYVRLCAYHHNMSSEGVHYDKKKDMELKVKARNAWMETYGKSLEDFYKRYGKTYLIEGEIDD